MWVVGLASLCLALEIGSRTRLKVMQFTDLHYGENEASDSLAFSLQSQLLDLENPDLVVITGDMVSGYAWDGREQWYAQQHARYIQPMQKRGIPWALTLGNHDIEADLNGEEIMRLDSAWNLSLSRPGPTYISHSSNYYVPITRQGKLVFILWMLDSGNRNHCLGMQGYDCIHSDQQEWLENTQKALFTGAGKPIPGFIFMHMPPIDYMDLWEVGKPIGFKYEDVSCWAVRTNFLQSLTHIVGVGVGHDHFNDYSGYWRGVNLYYGRKTGHAGNGPSPHFLRGARTYLITPETSAVESYITDEQGNRVVHKGKQGLREQQMSCAESSGWSVAAHRTLEIASWGAGLSLCAWALWLLSRPKRRLKSERMEA